MIPTISISQSRTKSNEYCRSPQLGSRSPSLARASTGKRLAKSDKSKHQRRHLSSDSEYHLPESSDDFFSTNALCSKHNGTLTCDGSAGDVFCGNGCKDNRGLSSTGSMALSAVMMSGGGGGGGGGGNTSGMSYSATQRTLPDMEFDNGNGTIWTMSNASEHDISRSWPGSPSSKCNCDKNQSRETVIINVGGNKFETFRSNLKRLKSCKLASDREMMKYYRHDKGDYFFDRDPYAFNIILNYLRYGDLHLPTNLCGPALMREFQYWGIDESDIER